LLERETERLHFEPEITRTAHWAPRRDFAHISSPVEVASAVAKKFGVGEIVVSSQYVSTDVNITHSYFKQVVNGLVVSNGDIGVNVNGRGEVVNSWESVYRGAVPAYNGAANTAEAAIRAFAKLVGKDAGEVVQVETSTAYPNAMMTFAVGFSEEVVPASLTYIHDDASLHLCWELVVNAGDFWWNAWVEDATLDVIAVHDWVQDQAPATYLGYLPPVTDPTFFDGVRRIGLEREAPSCPEGWHSINGIDRLVVTVGNMGCAQGNRQNSPARNCDNSWQRPNGGNPNELKFEFPVDLNGAPVSYLAAAVTNLFWWNNFIHDVFWYYGFTEVAGNFQENNFGRGGAQNDGVQAHAQDGSGTNNANFATPPDGQRPRMRMYVWTGNPQRDGDFDGAIVMHEYGHGISIRLTGGPQNVNCLGSGQAGGMGEGWGDFWGVTLGYDGDSDGADPVGMGAWAAGRPAGIRPHPYSTDMQINPQTYGLVGTAGYTGVHAIGSVWCQIILDAYWSFVNAFDFDNNWYPAPNTPLPAGNIRFWFLIVDALKLQPCTPNFLQARDAILLADRNRYQGAHQCLIWRAFARRGAGVSARSLAPTRVEQAFDFPPDCN